jgi:bifunctional non-homologous end joining protein LigD
MTKSSSTRRRPLGPPMLCKAIDVVPDDDRYLASRKYDGWRARATCSDQHVVLTSREGHALDSVPYVEAALQSLLPPGTVVDGELVDLAEPRQHRRTGSILSSGRPHRPSPESPPLTYAVFDILFEAGRDLRDTPLHERLGVLEGIFDTGAGRQQTAPLLTTRPEAALLVVEHRPSSSDYAEALIDAGEEGVVVKKRDSRYRHGARNGGWFKYKPQETVDAECTGILPGEGSVNSVGSIAFRLPSGVEGSAGSGISARDWAGMLAHPEGYIGRVIELAHYGIEKSGALRHPVYRGVRDVRDKAPRRANRAPREVPTPSAEKSTEGRRKRRNYKKMGDSKLMVCIGELRAGEGDAYQRCVERGSGDPTGDLAVALSVARERGLSA